MRESVGGKFSAAEQRYAKVDSIEAGILHSPAASFVDDQAAAIRVIYRPIDPSVGKKAVSYLKLDGRPIAMPRQTETFRETPGGARRTDLPKKEPQ
jgi:hypothetical protein